MEPFRSHTERIVLICQIEAWRENLLQYGVDELTGDSSDPNDFQCSKRCVEYGE